MANLTLAETEVEDQTSTPIEDTEAISEETSISSRLYKLKEKISSPDFAQLPDLERSRIKGLLAAHEVYNNPDFDYRKFTEDEKRIMVLGVEKKIANDNPHIFSSSYEAEVKRAKYNGRGSAVTKKEMKVRPLLTYQEELKMQGLNQLAPEELDTDEFSSERLLELRDELPIEEAYPDLYKRMTAIGKSRSGNLNEKEAFTLALANGVIPFFSEYIDLSDEEKASLFLGHEGFKSTEILGATASLVGWGWGIQAFRKSLGIKKVWKSIGLTMGLEGGLGLAYKNVAPGLLAELAGKPDSYILNFMEAAAISGLVDGVSALAVLAKWGKGSMTIAKIKKEHARIKKYMDEAAGAQEQLDKRIAGELSEVVDTPARKGTPGSKIDIDPKQVEDLPKQTQNALISKLPKSTQGFAKRINHFWRKFGTKEGLATKEIYEADYAKTSALNAHLKGIENAYLDYDKAVLSTYKSHDLPSEVMDQVNAVLSDRASASSLPKGLDNAVHNMRVKIDDFTKELQELDFLDGDLKQILTKNQGMYVYHSYKSYTDPDWANKVDPKVISAAKSFLRSEPSSRYGYMKGKGGRLDNEEIDEVIERFINPRPGSKDSFSRADLGGKGNVKHIFKKRKNIPKQILGLMGPEDDPARIFLRTAQQQANFLETQRMFERMRKEGLNKVFHPRRTGIYTEKVTLGLDEGAPLRKRLKKSFEDTYTSPEIAEYLKNLEGNQFSKSPGGWLYAHGILLPKRLAQTGKTVLNPATHIRNFFSSAGMVAANGNFLRPFFRGIGKGEQEGFQNAWDTVWGDLAGTDDKARRLILQEYQKLGIVGTQAELGTIHDLLKDLGKRDADSFIAMAEHGLVQKAKLPFRKAFKAYQAEDDFWKIYNFEAEKQAYEEIYGIKESFKRNFPTRDIPMTEAAMKKELDAGGFEFWSKEKINGHAAKLTRDQIPNYREVSEGIKLLRRAPIGDFITFPAEIFRTSGNIMVQGFTEMQNPLTFKIGARRLSAFTLYGALGAGTTAAVSRVRTKTSKQQDHDARRFMPSYRKNSDLIYLSRAKDGVIKYIDQAFIDPYSALKKPLFALIRNLSGTDSDKVMTDLRQGLGEAAMEVLDPFIGDLSLGVKYLAEIGFNVKIENWEKRGEIWTDADTLGSQIAKGMTHTWNKTFEPGGITQAKKLSKAALGRKGLDLETEILASMGVRISTLDIKEALGYKGADLSRGIKKARDVFTKKAKDSSGAVTPKELIDVLYNSQVARFNYFQEAYRDIEAAVSNGVDRKKALRAFTKTSRLNKRDIYAISRGGFNPYLPSKDTYRRMLESGRSVDELRVIRNGTKMVVSNFKNIPLEPDPDREEFLPDNPY